MNTLIHADVFFFISSIFIVVLTIGLAISFVYVVLILRDMRGLSGLAKRGGEELSGDISALRYALKEEGVKARVVYDFFISLFVRKNRNDRKKNISSERK